MTTAPTACGRPGLLDVGKFARYTTSGTTLPLIYGDPNYGIITGDTPPSSGYNAEMTGVPAGWFLGPGPGTNPDCSQTGNIGNELECPIGTTGTNSNGCTYPSVPAGCVMTWTGSSC